MLIGYARISTDSQELSLQRDALRAAGCERIFEDVASGAKTDREGLEQALTFARPGDVLVTWKMDRVARSLGHLINVIGDLQRREVGFKSITESIDTTSPAGKLVFHLFGALAEFERDLIRERTLAGLASARVRGRLGGRPRVMDPAKIKLGAAMLRDSSTTVSEVCRTLKISRATAYRFLPIKDLRAVRAA